MSWKFGPFTVSTREVVDIETINESLLSVIEEVTGELNEHNFAENSFNSTDRTLLAEDIGIRLHSVSQAADTYLTATNSQTTPNTIPVSTNWQPVDPTLTETVSSKGGKLWILASFQIEVNSDFGALFAIEVNGVVLGDSLIGTGDIDNDKLDNPTGTNIGPIPCLWFPQAGCVVLEAVLTVSPGQYVVQPVMRNPRLGGNQTQVISHRELIIVEMR